MEKFQSDPKTFYIKVTSDGPYLVYGNPPVDQEIITPDRNGKSWTYRKGKHFNPEAHGCSPDGSCCALCRCGESKEAPFCDGSHASAAWSPQETAGFEPLSENAEIAEGPAVTLEDNEKYCAYARFCDAYGTVWRLVRKDLDKEGMEIFRHETEHCPSGRLIGRNSRTGELFEPEFDPSIGLIEDPQLAISGPIWVKGGIRIESADGRSYEIRNRVTLCRCGASSNKPFCDGSHASVEYDDKLGSDAGREEW